MTTLVVFLFGLEFGSFANVCIHRWPRNQSVFHPARSHCPRCNALIRWWQNIPVVSYLFLRGRCASCRSKISARYPVIETLTAVLWVIGWRILRSSFFLIPLPFLISSFAFLLILLITTVTDLDWKIIPDEAVFLLLTVGLVTSAWNPLLGVGVGSRIGQSVLGSAAGWAPLWIIGQIGRKIFGKEAVGEGDMKLLAAIGSVIGPLSAVSILFFGAVIGGVVAAIGLLARVLKRHQYLPFGPFLNTAALLEFIFRCRGTSIFTLSERFFL